MDWTKLLEWDELLIVVGVALVAFDFGEIGFWITALGVFLFVTTEGYL